MTDLQIGLAVVGAVAVVAVLLYNRLQERAVRREAESRFASRHADALLEEPAAKREPILQATPRAALWDYVMELSMPVGAAPAFQPIQERFANRALLSELGDGRWQIALQMVSRGGVVSEAELLEFRSRVETLAASLGASVAAPEMRAALEAAQALDRALAEADIQVALHVVGVSEPGDAFDGQPFQVTRRADGLTFLLDVPRTAGPARSFEAMVRAGRGLAQAHGARLVDDNGNELDERALAAIGAELDAVRHRLAQSGIEPGSPLALRLFS